MLTSKIIPKFGIKTDASYIVDKLLKTYRCNTPGPSPFDPNDHRAALVPYTRREIRYLVWCSLVEDQGQTQSCVAQGDESFCQVPVNALRGTDIQDGLKMVNLDAMGHFADICDAFYGGDQSKGAYPRDGMDRLLKVGIAELRPQAGTIHKINRYWRCDSIADAERSMAFYGPVTVVVKVHLSFYDAGYVYGGPTGQYDFVTGFHQICAVARIRHNGVWGFVLKNSWGPAFGKDGYVFISDAVWDRIVVECWGAEYAASLEQKKQLCERYMEAV